jgi:hypothetical protein
MGWYGIRSLFHFGTKSDGTNIFEERVVCFEAATSDEALERGLREAQAYAEENGLTRYPEHESYEQDGDTLIDGYEVWSTMFEFRGSLEEFYQQRYKRYEYRPE